MTPEQIEQYFKEALKEAKQLPQAQRIAILYTLKGYLNAAIEQAASDETPVKRHRGPNKPKTASPTLNLGE